MSGKAFRKTDGGKAEITCNRQAGLSVATCRVSIMVNGCDAVVVPGACEFQDRRVSS